MHQLFGSVCCLPFRTRYPCPVLPATALPSKPSPAHVVTLTPLCPLLRNFPRAKSPRQKKSQATKNKNRSPSNLDHHQLRHRSQLPNSPASRLDTKNKTNIGNFDQLIIMPPAKQWGKFVRRQADGVAHSPSTSFARNPRGRGHRILFAILYIVPARSCGARNRLENSKIQSNSHYPRSWLTFISSPYLQMTRTASLTPRLLHPWLLSPADDSSMTRKTTTR